MKKPKRLVLFDIDGTILWGGPVWKESFLKAMSHFFPDFQFPKVSFGGKTDLQICREMMEQTGFSSEKIEESMRLVTAHYVETAAKTIQGREHEVQLLPGVQVLVEQLAQHPEVLLGLLTGNVKQGALAKLSCVELEHHFKIGVFGDDHWDRYRLPELAIQRTKEELGLDFKKKEIVIIGDTIHDVNCGKAVGARSIAVGTGRNVPMEELLAHNPDYYFRDLSSTFDVLQAILEDLPDEV